ncbi:MAG TPA: hypothetical protein VNR70_07670 [Steroidobacteraceae bacterium]|nr:hypothetical protein [Steroidobacteraceae bacterium]
MIDLNEFTEEELSSFNAARDALRAHLPEHGFIHTDWVRNPSGTLAAVRVFDHEGGRMLAEVAIRSDGALAPVRVG